MDVANCAGVPVDVNGNNGPIGNPACLAKPTKISTLTPMGAYTQGAWDRVVGANGLPTWGPNLDANTVYISDSPGATTQIVRYTINKDTQDSYSNFGVFPDGSMAQYSFGFSPTQSPDGRMFLGDDPSAGATSFNGHIWMVAAKAPADVLGQPGIAAAPPPLPSAKVGAIYGSGVTLPNDGVWLPGALGGHLWIADGASGFCRMDANSTPGAAAPFALNPSVCDLSTAKPGQPAYDPHAQADGTHFVYLPDQSTRGVGVIRVKFDPTTETIVSGSAVTVAPGQGLDGQKTSGAAVEPSSGNLYVGFLNRNSTAPTEIARVHNPDSASPTVDFVANTTRQKPVYTLAFIGDDLYIGNNGGLDVLPNADACAPGGCQSVQVANVRGPRGLATDGTSIFMAGPSIPAGCTTVATCPAPGTLNTPVQAYNPSTGDLITFSSQGMLADGSTLSQYDVVDSITVDPSGNVYVADDPSAIGLPASQGRVFKVTSAAQEPLPAIVSKPSNPTNQGKPTFGFQSADSQATFQCSLVASTAADAFQACGSNGTGTVVFGADASGAVVQNGANPIADGAYVFRVQATSPAGVKSPIASYPFSISTAAPTVSITAQPSSPTKSNAPSYSFQSSVPSTFQCSLTPSGGLEQLNPCTSPKAYSAQADGTYTFKVIGSDAAGNQATATATTVIDTTAPTVSASPTGGQFTAGPSVVLTASEPSTIYYTLDGTTPSTSTTTKGASPLTVNVSASATLKYLAVDAAGNAGQVGSQAYSIGSVGLTQTPPALSNSTSPSFTFTDAVAGATFQCSLVQQSAADAFSACTSPRSYSNITDGAYRFVVQDSTGSQASYLFSVDTTAPTVSITENPANPDTSSSGTFAFTSSEAKTTFSCSFEANGAADVWNPCTSPTTESNLADGSYVFQVKGTDASGNTGQPASYQFMVSAGGVTPSATAPQATLVGLTTAQSGTSATTSAKGPLGANTNAVPVSISWTGTACQSGETNCNVDHYVLQQSINGAAFSTISLPSPTATSVTLNLKPSPTNNSAPQVTYRYQVQAVDKSGKLSPFAAGPTFSVPDTDNSFQSSFKGSWSGQNVNGAFNGSVQFSTTAGATANPSNGLTATSYALVSTLGPDRGKADILVDGQTVATVDLYAPVQQTGQVVWSINGLQPGVTHTIQVVSTNTRNPSSTGTRVDYDAILALK
jgi:hypothetical protein